MSWVFSSSGWAATYSTLPVSRNPRSSRRAVWAVIGSAATTPRAGPVQKATADRRGSSQRTGRCDPWEQSWRRTYAGSARWEWPSRPGREAAGGRDGSERHGVAVRPLLFLHGERDRVLRGLPHHLEHAPAAARRLDGHRELVDRLVEGRLLEVDACQLIGLLGGLVVGDAPLAGLLVDDELRGAVLGRER